MEKAGVPVHYPPAPPPSDPKYVVPYGAAPAPSPNAWTTGLCGCFEDGASCCITCWLPCISFGQVAHILDRGATPCWLAGCLVCLLAGIGSACIYTCGYRGKLRQKYGLPADPCNDCLVDWVCPFCSICQQYRELKNRGIQPSLGFEAVKHIYDQPPPVQQMHY